MKPAAPESPLAQRFASALAEAGAGHARIRIETYTTAFLRAEPSLATSTERRARLGAAIEELVDARVIKASRVLDRSEAPALPRFVVLVDDSADPPVGREAAAYAWRPELTWAARLPLRRSEFAALQAIQAFLRDHLTDNDVIPSRERSLQVFGDEKRLDALLRNRRLFAPGRLSLELLRSRLHAPPFAYRQIGPGPVALVLENVATYRSVLAALPAGSPVGIVVFGAGSNFAASVCYFAELAAEGPASSINEIRYFGDLDRRGLEIPIAASAAARASRLPPVRPAIALWAMLLREGHRAVHPCVEAAVADRLVTWLPSPLRASAARVLTSGARLAQEATGTTALSGDTGWATWAGLGPPGAERASDPALELRRPVAVLARSPAAPTGDAAITQDDNGHELTPDNDADWSTWVAASATRNWVLGDPLLDWLDAHGERTGFRRDDQREHYDLRTDFRRFVTEKSLAFEGAVLGLLRLRAAVVQIAEAREDARSLAKARATIEALRAGIPVVAQGVLRNPARRTYGVVDLLVRSDLLARWFPELLSSEEAALPAPGLGLAGFHYRPVDVKFHTFDISADGHVTGSADQLAAGVQIWLYAEALGRIQGHQPRAGYLLGRNWKEGEKRGEGCLERLARVDLDRWLPNRELTIETLAAESIGWLQGLAAHGNNWSVLPQPSVPELYPHARNADDAPWHFAKREIAEALGELTLLPGMNPVRRVAAHAAGLRSWRDPSVSATTLGITAPAHAARADAVLAANRATAPTVVPVRIEADSSWREPAALEFYVDFETVSNLDDDFTLLPRSGGQPLVVQIGCGRITNDRRWSFAQWSVDALTVAEERRIIDAWISHLLADCDSAGVGLDVTRIFHWSAAEPANLETAYNAARTRQAGATWPCSLPWFDVLERVIRATPVAVTASFSFGLKSVAKAMQKAGLTSTVWSDGPTDGLGAMVATWSAAQEAVATGVPLSKHPLMIEVARYNETDCRAMAEVLAWLRANR